MPYHRLSTAKIARAVGCHPNTVRLYETLGFLPPVERNAKGYRLYTFAHLNQMRLAVTALITRWPGRPIRHSALALVRQTASGDLGGGLESAYRHLALVRSELVQAETAVRLLERWAHGAPTDATTRPLRISETARLLNLTTDKLRNWERNGLIEVPHDPNNHYRQYGQTEIARLRVIRMLMNAGYSTMAILRMLLRLDRGDATGLRETLDTPGPDEDVYTAADQWLSTLTDQEERALKLIEIIEGRMEEDGLGGGGM
ncbi:MAG TPA: MerR family transcriptional regulator [Anaerolineaceae bacterium]|nr:MerR family transcriptional regulator [Anaerolineaceae bacterium]